MGSLNLPSGGLVYLDAQVLIYSVETHLPYWPILRPMWEQARQGQIRLLTSELTLLETLVGPLKRGDPLLANAYEHLLASNDIRLAPLDRPTLRKAAELRAAFPALRTPDAIHAATAMLAGCAAFLSNDGDFRQLAALPLTLLDDRLNP